MDKNEQAQRIYRAPSMVEKQYFYSRKDTAQDKRLSWEARGILWYLLSKPPDWEVQISDLIMNPSCGRDKVYRILGELRTHGYMIYHEIRSEEKKVIDTYYTVHEEPITDLPETGKPYAGKPFTANTELTNNRASTNAKSRSARTNKSEVAGAPSSGQQGKPAEKALTPAQQRQSNLRMIIAEYRDRSEKKSWIDKTEKEFGYVQANQTLLCGVDSKKKKDGAVSTYDYIVQNDIDEIVFRSFCHWWVFEQKMTFFEDWVKLHRQFFDYYRGEMAEYLPGFKARFEAGTLWNKPAAPAAAPEPQDTPVHVFSDMDYLDEIGE